MGNDLSNPNVMPRSIKKYGGFTNDELKDLRRNFQSICNANQILDRKKIFKFFKGTPQELDSVFEFLDVDKTGAIDEYEFICSASILRQSSLSRKAKVLFQIYAISGTHMIEEPQLFKLLKTVNNTLLSLQGNQDLDDEEISRQCGDYFSKYDLNKDGSFSELEFIELVLKDKKVIKLFELYGFLTQEDIKEIKDEDETDNDLQNELNLQYQDTDERTERIKSGIEHNHNPDEELFTEAESTGGDQFMAVRPAKGAIDNSQPTSYKPYKGETDPPKAELELEFVHGYRCHDARNNLKLSSSGKIVYHTAGVGIVFDSKTRTQQFFMEHSDDILCLDVYENLVATGQIGHKPLICIWDVKDRTSKIILKGALEKGVVNICFSPDGKRFAASSLDDEHNIIVYDIEREIKARENPGKAGSKGGLLAAGKGSKAEILDLKFTPDCKTLIASCNKEIYFITIDETKGILQSKKGLFGKTAPEPVLCIGFVKNLVVTGLSKGTLLLWNGSSAGKTIEKAHEGAVNAMHSVKPYEKLLTGGNDGMIHYWDGNMSKLFSVSLKDERISSMNPKVRALYEKEGILYVGTRGSEIIEFKNKNPSVLIKGHYDGELWGLGIHPNQSIYYTVGEDMMLASWDISSKSQISNIKIPNAAKTLNMSSDTKYIAIGCMNGSILIVNGDKKMVISNTLKNKNEVSIVKFSPNSEYLAAGFAPPASEVIIYNVKKNFAIQCRLKGCNSRIIQLDFSEDSKVLQLNTSGYELLYFDTSSGSQLTHGASQNRDEKWATWTCIIGWPVQGMWPPCSDGSDINSVDRNLKGDVLATADDFGKVKLFKFPCVKPQSNFNKYGGHSAHVTSVRFTYKNDYLISTGGGEKSIFQWKFITENQSVSAENEEKEDESPTKIQDEEVDEFAEEEQGEGDQMGACKPFVGQLFSPTWYKPSKNDKVLPKGNLSLHYVFGYRCFDDCRNTAKFLADGQIVFVGAAVGVVLNYKQNKQTFFNKHEEDIISMAVHPKGNIIATGQMAAKGKAKTIDLYVWNSETKEAYCNLNSFHLRAVNQVSFSPDGTKLLSTGQDDNNSLAIHDWNSKTLLCTSNFDKAKVTAVAWKPDSNTEFVTAGAKVIKFWTLNGRNLSAKLGQMSPNEKLFPFTCVAFAFKSITCVTGSSSGDIATWNGASAGKKVKAHQGEVGCLFGDKDLLYSGGGDGKVIIWENTKGLVQKSVVLEVSTLTQFNPGVRSIDIFNDKLLIATRGSEIFVQEKNKIINVLQGHYDGEVWGCAASPNDHKFVSCGGDKTIRLWDAKTCKMICGTPPLENDLRALDWAANGKFIIAADVRGKIMLLNPDKLEILSSLQSYFKKNEKKLGDPWIEDIKISPKCDTTIFGAHGGNPEIQVMSIEDDKKLKNNKIIKAANSSALTHLDYSEDGDMFVINTQDYWLRFYSINQGNSISASGCRDVKWFTWTCTLGFYSQGVFPGVDGTDVNSVCRSNNQRVLATGDDFGKVNLFNFPCVVPKAPCISYIGHSSHVTKVKFSFDDSFLFSTGGNDKCVMVWKTDFGSMKSGQSKIESKEMEEETEGQDDCVKTKVKKVGNEKFGNKKNNNHEEDEEGLFEEDNDDQGDEFMAVKPWLGAIKEPTGFKMPKDQNKAPGAELNLEYVFGYRAKDCRNNIRFLKNGNIVYHAAAVGIVLDQNNNTQKFFNKHTDDITAFDLHPDDETVATGEIGAKPVIYVWNSNTMEVKNTFKAVILKGIAALAFSPSGNRLVAAAIDDDHWVAVLNLQGGGQPICKVKGGRDVIISLAFNTEDEFASVGAKHYKYWKISGANCAGTKGDQELKITLNCSEFYDGNCFIGASDGSLFCCKGSSMGKPRKIHDKSIDALYVNQDLIITGGRDNIINILSRNLNILTKIDTLKSLEGSVCPNVRAVYLSGNNILIGTYGSEIYQLTCADKNIKEKSAFDSLKCFMNGHYTPNKQWTNEVWGLAPFHDGDKYATCSDDGTLRIFSSKERRQLKVIQTNLDSKKNVIPFDKATNDLQDSVKGRCVDISPDGESIAVGFKDGTVRIYNSEDLEQEHLFKQAKEWISDLKYSPDGKLLAVGSHDNAIYVYTVPDYKRKCFLNKHSSYITHLDWSENSVNLHSNCGAYELLFWDVESGKQMPGGASALRDENWASWTCVLGFPVQGIWPACADGTDINYVDRSKNKHPSGYYLLASGDDFGKVRLLKYPSILKSSDAVYGSGHSSHIPCVKWSNDDEFLYSVGGEDNCVFQWNVTKK